MSQPPLSNHLCLCMGLWIMCPPCTAFCLEQYEKYNHTLPIWAVTEEPEGAGCVNVCYREWGWEVYGQTLSRTSVWVCSHWTSHMPMSLPLLLSLFGHNASRLQSSNRMHTLLVSMYYWPAGGGPHQAQMRRHLLISLLGLVGHRELIWWAETAKMMGTPHPRLLCAK